MFKQYFINFNRRFMLLCAGNGDYNLCNFDFIAIFAV